MCIDFRQNEMAYRKHTRKHVCTLFIHMPSEHRNLKLFAPSHFLHSPLSSCTSFQCKHNSVCEFYVFESRSLSLSFFLHMHLCNKSLLHKFLFAKYTLIHSTYTVWVEMRNKKKIQKEKPSQCKMFLFDVRYFNAPFRITVNVDEQKKCWNKNYVHMQWESAKETTVFNGWQLSCITHTETF